MLLFNTLHIAVLPVIWLSIISLVTLQILTLIFATLPGNALLAWCVNVLGISALYLRQPHAVMRLLQFLVPSVGAAAMASYLLRAPNPLPVTVVGYSDVTVLRWSIIGLLTLGISLPRIWGGIREMRRPLWGEARLLERASRTGNLFFFTSAGRAYLRDRFGTSPEDFIRIVRRRSSPLATGTPM